VVYGKLKNWQSARNYLAIPAGQFVALSTCRQRRNLFPVTSFAATAMLRVKVVKRYESAPSAKKQHIAASHVRLSTGRKEATRSFASLPVSARWRQLQRRSMLTNLRLLCHRGNRPRAIARFA